MKDLKDSGGLDPDQLIANNAVDLGVVTASGNEGSDSLDENVGPAGERGPVIGNQVQVDDGVDRLGGLLAGDCTTKKKSQAAR